jgi:CRP-like cAMP-binding protein
VVKGRLHIVNEDYWGNRSLLTEALPGDVFAEAAVCAGSVALPVSVVAAEGTDVLQLDYRRIITTCTSACAFHTSLVENMLKILAQKNLALVEKIEHITKRTTQKKLLSYLSEVAKHTGKGEFDIPYNRQELADYLAVERSALSAELSKMQDMGLLRFQKNHFVLLAPAGEFL